MAFKEKATWKNIRPSSPMTMEEAKKNLREWSKRNHIRGPNLEDVIKRDDLTLKDAKALLKAIRRDSKKSNKH